MHNPFSKNIVKVIRWKTKQKGSKMGVNKNKIWKRTSQRTNEKDQVPSTWQDKSLISSRQTFRPTITLLARPYLITVYSSDLIWYVSGTHLGYSNDQKYMTSLHALFWCHHRYHFRVMWHLLTKCPVVFTLSVDKIICTDPLWIDVCVRVQETKKSFFWCLLSLTCWYPACLFILSWASAAEHTKYVYSA